MTIAERSRGAAPAHVVSAVLLLSFAGCWDGRWPADGALPHEGRVRTPPREISCDPGRDRAAILAMAGTYQVSFAFEEIEALAPDYQLREPYRTQGTEVVIVLSDEPTHVSLQHLMLIQQADASYQAMKHWRQDWTFQDDSLLEFQGRRVWQQRTLSESERRCSWSQAVYQVDDGPRYESYGRFVHEPARSTWTSHETYRPLPRRESSQRSDYDVLLALNSHIITPTGWTHREDNLKWLLDTQAALVRETHTARVVSTVEAACQRRGRAPS